MAMPQTQRSVPGVLHDNRASCKVCYSSCVRFGIQEPASIFRGEDENNDKSAQIESRRVKGQAKEVLHFGARGSNLGEEARHRIVFEITAFASRFQCGSFSPCIRPG